MSILVDTPISYGENIVTALRGIKTRIEVVPGKPYGAPDTGASVWILNMYGTPLTWLSTPNGSAYVVEDHIMFHADSPGEVKLEYSIDFPDGSTEVSRAIIYSR